MNVTPVRPIRSSKYAGSDSAPGLGSTTLPPLTSGSNISLIPMSNPSDDLCSATSSAPNPRTSACHNSRLQIPACVTITPFGAPVEPDVKTTYARSDI
ncbi:Uncharacterised protein [Mycobacteroides abscessus subsp. abscessus]|nr:Uncharacterised protein [Mycobacteroides abscessus subsp. abscessus]